MEILAHREERDEFEQTLLKEFPLTLLTLRANFPGEDKRHSMAVKAVEILHDEVLKRFEPVFEDSTCTREGLIFYLLVQEPPRVVKKAALEIEESHPLGRLVDLDVRDEEKIWSRRDFGLSLRKCYLCEDPAVHCVRSMKHELEEIISHFTENVESYLVAHSV